MTLSHTSSTIVATSQRAQSLFETKSQRTQRTTRYNLPVDSQIKHALHHRTARHPTDFFVISFIFFCYNLFVCCDRFCFSAAKLHNSDDTTKLFSTFLLKNLPSDISLHIKIRSSSLNLYFGVLLRQTIREAWADYTKGARRAAYRLSAFCLSIVGRLLIAQAPSAYRSWAVCLFLVTCLLIARGCKRELRPFLLLLILAIATINSYNCED